MIGVMEVVDKDTFATRPEKATDAKEKMLELGKTFKNAGVYIAQHLDRIEDGREIAEALALEFYQYGQSLVLGKTQEISRIEEIASRNLTPQDTEVMDQFLAGDTLYESRKQRAEKLNTDKIYKDELYEDVRQKTLAQFFRVAEKAFALKSKGADGELPESPTKPKTWQSDTPIHSAFLRRIDEALTKQIEAPKQEFGMAIFRRGLEKLIGEMKELGWNLGLNLRVEQRRLVEALNVPKMKADLEVIRQKGDATSITSKELEIADKIQKAVSGFPYQSTANNPAEMVVNQYINCVGASTLGGALMKEAGLNYLVGDVPDHSILFLVTSDGSVQWRDMLNASFNEYLTDEMIKGQRRDGKLLTVSDIVAFSQKPSPEGLMFDIDSSKYREKLSWIREGQRQYVAVFEPEYGQYIQILNNTGNALANLRRHEEAVVAYRQAIGVNPKYAYAYNNLGCALANLRRHEEAVEAYRQAIGVDPKFASPYNNLGNALANLGRHKEAVEAYQQAIRVDPKYAYLYNGLGNALADLGRHKEAVEAYKKFIDLADKNSDDYFIRRAETKIAELKK